MTGGGALAPGARERLAAAAAAGLKRAQRGVPATLPDAADLDAWCAFLEDPEPTVEKAHAMRWDGRPLLWLWDAQAEWTPLLQLLSLGQLVRLGALMRFFHGTRGAPYSFGVQYLLILAARLRQLQHLDFGLEDVAREAAFALDGNELASTFLWSFSKVPLWRPDDVARLFRGHLDVLDHALASESPPVGILSWPARRSTARALEIIRSMPDLPAQLEPRVWRLALGGVQADRAAAQACLDRLVDPVPRLLEELSGKQAAREIAAEWLAARRDVRAVPALTAALKKEKSTRGQAGLMRVLEAHGASLDEFLDRGGLARVAAKGLAKGIPEGLAWFPFDALPDVHWADDGQPVARDVVRWWIVQACAVGAPEPSPLLRQYARRIRPDEAQALGRAVLVAWTAHDVRIGTPAEIDARVNQMLAVNTFVTRADALRFFEKMPVGTAIGQKGVLSVAGAFAGPAAALVVAPFLKEWYGNRAAQCKALLAMLAWVDDRAAVQVLLATATRFRTAGIRKVAEECVQELAARHGWSVDELADRTVPVPSPDEKKAYQAVMKQQRERLYLAMCRQRRWTCADWREFLLGHPIVGPLCSRVIWMAEDGRTFRPLGDGSLTGADDAAVPVADDARIGIAHPLVAPAGALAGWKQHLVEYEVEPLFEQLDRAPFRLPDGRRDELELGDFEGHMIEAFKLRNRATRLGYSRGPNVDGGWFDTYVRQVPGLDLEPQLQFSGLPPPYENVPVALLSLRFARKVEGSGMVDLAPLSEVPAVLVSECFNDLREIASEGTGYDAGWMKKVGR